MTTKISRIKDTVRIGLCIALAAALCSCAGMNSQTVENAPSMPTIVGGNVLPVKRVVLFQNGVAYLERRGSFDGDELHLKVRPTQIQDILKSITVVDFKGGHASSLALPVDVSSARALSELPKLALGQGALGDILNVIRGATVHMQTSLGTFEGRMVGVDAGAGENEGQQVSILDREGTIRTFPRKEVRSVRILDSTLSQGLEKGLDISLGNESWMSIDLGIYLNKGGGQERDLLVSYLVEMPTWKPSYRLVLDKAGDTLLQGWAIVDNVSGADWKDVQLTLTTGSPVSFLYDLYTPRFVERPNLTPTMYAGIAPPAAVSATTVASAPAGGAGYGRYEAEKKGKKDYASPKTSVAGQSRAQMPRRARAADRTLADEETGADYYDGDVDAPAAEQNLSTGALYDSMRVQAQAQKVGSLYRFDLGEPMTVPNRSSTMIALLNKKVPGEAIYYYNPEAGLEAARQHPFRAVSLQNQTEAVLEPGPISIIRDGTFVGEGLIERIEKGNRTYVSYALDTAVNVTHNQGSTSEVASLVKISRGVIETKTFSILKTTFEAQASKDDGEAIPLMLSIPKRQGWEMELTGGKQESETAVARFLSMPIKPGEKTTLEVKEKYPSFASYSIGDARAQQALLVYIQSKEAKPELVAKLQPIVDKVRKLSDTQAKIQTTEQKRSDLQQRAEEIRDNLRLLKRSRNQKLKDEQTARLVEVDRQLNQATDQLVAARDQAAELSVELSTLIEKLEITF